MTCLISAKSSPFEATELATMTSFLPVLKDLMAYSRSSWAGVRGEINVMNVSDEGLEKARTFTAMNSHSVDSLEQQVLVDI